MKYDERDTMFARMNYTPDHQNYRDYYRAHRENQAVDDALRKRLPISKPDAEHYDVLKSPMVDAGFSFLSDIRKLSDGQCARHQTAVSPAEATDAIRYLAALNHALGIGFCRLDQAHVYSHRGRHHDVYGEKVELHHRHAIAFYVAMDADNMAKAPQIEESVAVVHGYVQAAVVGMMIAYYIRALGYEATNHMDGHYRLVAPLVAQEAGLGQIGRHGLLITPEHGSYIRLGVVTTNLPIIENEPIDFGVTERCRKCGRCAQNCPAQAISPKSADVIHEPFNRIKAEKCFGKWLDYGTDCGICLATCPYNRRNK